MKLISETYISKFEFNFIEFFAKKKEHLLKSILQM
jgi:hypothetical protein